MVRNGGNYICFFFPVKLPFSKPLSHRKIRDVDPSRKEGPIRMDEAFLFLSREATVTW